MSDERTLRIPENIELKHLRARVEELEKEIRSLHRSAEIASALCHPDNKHQWSFDDASDWIGTILYELWRLLPPDTEEE